MVKPKMSVVGPTASFSELGNIANQPRKLGCMTVSPDGSREVQKAQRGQAGDQTIDLPIAGRPALPPEQQIGAWSCYLETWLPEWRGLYHNDKADDVNEGMERQCIISAPLPWSSCC